MVAKFSSSLGTGSRGAALIRGLAALQEMIMCSDGRELLLHGHPWALLLANLGEGKAHSSVCPELYCCCLCPLTSSDVVFPLFSCAELQSLEKQLVSAGNGWVCTVLS